MPKADPVVNDQNGPDPRVMLALWVVPLFVYVGLIGRWSMDTDEIYTYIDSSQSLRELLSYERKPIYYLNQDFLESLGLGTEEIARIRDWSMSKGSTG